MREREGLRNIGSRKKGVRQTKRDQLKDTKREKERPEVQYTRRQKEQLQ